MTSIVHVYQMIDNFELEKRKYTSQSRPSMKLEERLRIKKQTQDTRILCNIHYLLSVQVRSYLLFQSAFIARQYQNMFFLFNLCSSKYQEHSVVNDSIHVYLSKSNRRRGSEPIVYRPRDPVPGTTPISSASVRATRVRPVIVVGVEDSSTTALE